MAMLRMTDACLWHVSENRDIFGKPRLGLVVCEDHSDL